MAFGSEQWMYSAGGFYPHEIEQSLRFNNADSAYLSRTPAVAGNRKTWTWSGWVKRGALGEFQGLIGASLNYANVGYVTFNGSDALQYVSIVGGQSVVKANVSTTSVFRDVSSWYHVIIVVDYTETTGSDRVKIYVNGVKQPLTFSTTPSSTDVTMINAANPNYIGRLANNSNPQQNYYLDGYLAEVNFVDGQALDPADFGEFKSGVWIPKEYSGTYGTNGFYLPFDDANFVGKDNSTVLGPDLVTNGSFDTDVSSWIPSSCTTSWVSSGKMQITRTGGNGPVAYQAITCEVGATYAITAQLNSVGSRADVRVMTSVGSGGIFSLIGTHGSTLDLSGQFTATQTTHYLQFAVDNGGTSIIVDEVSVKKIISQGNDWTPNNLSPTDQMLGSPTNNFCTMNALDKTDVLTLAEGNLLSAHTSGVGTWNKARGTMGMSSGKWYWEVMMKTSNFTINGIEATTCIMGATHPGSVADSYGYYNHDGKIYVNNTNSSYGATYTVGDVVGVALDLDAGTLTFYKNGVSQGVAATSLTATPYAPTTGVLSNGSSVINFGQDSSFAGNKTAQGNTDANDIGDFYYAPPADHLALCSANLPALSIDPVRDDTPADYFNPVLSTGNASTQSITGVGFQPDWVWMKVRSDPVNHILYDSVRGVEKYLVPNLTTSEGTSTEGLTSFDSDGFTLGNINPNSSTSYSFVSWNWKAGGTAVANTDGTIASQVSANPKAGFSIVTYTGTGTNATVGHGLSSVPELAIWKNRSAATEWVVQSNQLSGSDKLVLNTDAARATDFDLGNFNSTTSTTLALQNDTSQNASGQGIVCYAFHGVEGFSKIGSYTGNGSANGPFVYTGFRPAYVMVKASSRTGSWQIFDSKRSPYNIADKGLLPNLSNAEAAFATNFLDITSNGFKLRGDGNGTNGSAETYIYMAFAEQPFKYANAR